MMVTAAMLSLFTEVDDGNTCDVTGLEVDVDDLRAARTASYL